MKKLNVRRWWDERRARGESSPPPTNAAPGTPLPRWLLIFIALPAAVAIWTGWVRLGEFCGFGPVRPLPGILPLTINTAITLPIGMEAFAGYALGVWLRSSPVPDRARAFAKFAAVGALALGMFGQVASHLLSAWHWTAAPTGIVIVVSCIPVGVVGLAAALAHLMSAPATETQPPGSVLDKVPSDVLAAAKASMAATYAAGNPLTRNQLQNQFSLTRAAATEIRDAVVSMNGDGPHE